MNLAFGWKMLIVVDMCLALYLYFTYIVNVTIRNDSEDNVCIAVSQYRSTPVLRCYPISDNAIYSIAIKYRRYRIIF